MSTSHLQPHPTSQPDHNNVPIFDVIIRFSASIPDLPLTVPASNNATTATLKQLIRASLPSDLKSRRIRLIYSGKALSDDSRLDVSLKRSVSHTPSRAPTPNPFDDTEATRTKGKGKEVIRDVSVQTRIYIHCSIGDVVLSSAELAEEANLAERTQPEQTGRSQHEQGSNHEEPATTTPAPRGFDRLLTAGFSAAEVQSLRLQFMDIQAHVHTPDTMPSPNTLRDMEDRWLDNGNGDGAGTTGMGAGSADDDTQVGALDDMLWGAAMGFFWPVGCLFWGAREEGIWSQRRRMAVVIGIALNIGIGLIRYTS